AVPRARKHRRYNQRQPSRRSMQRILWTLALTLALAASLAAQDAKPVNPPQDPAAEQEPLGLGEESLIKVDVSRVPLLFTVTDKKNRFITDLEKDDFEIRDNGEIQEIREFARESDLPLRIGILMDTSN